MKLNKTYLTYETVQFEDVDLGGIVHHPSHLKYMERGRIASLNEEGVNFLDLLKMGYSIVVAGLEIKYKRSIKFSQKLVITTKCCSARKGIMEVEQNIYANEKRSLDQQGLATAARLKLAWVNLESGRLIDIPKEFSFLVKPRNE